MFPAAIDRASRKVQVSYRIALVISLVVWLLPLLAILLTSARSLDDINQGNYWGLPSQWRLWENYSAIFQGSPMLGYLWNSALITGISVAGTLLISSLAGFALAVYRFRGGVLVFVLFVAGNFVPFQILMLPVRSLMVKLGMYDSYWALVLFHIAFQAGFCTLFMRNFIITLPRELLEAARLDGASELQIYFRIVLPLVRPALAALAVLTFTFVWNDYFWALVLVQSDEVRPITIGLNALRGQWVSSWQMISAGAVVAALPPVALFFAMQRHFIAGLTLGASKG
ncbi:MAG: carbohydrate ABC transporter permease [Myxococcales bacterium]|nr:carbohydrate ABC transporter permease [Myxococcales bacterium]